jgi:hypothetical protein
MNPRITTFLNKHAGTWHRRWLKLLLLLSLV